MAKRKNPSIAIYDIKTFRELSHIQKIVKTEYKGEMPISIYNGFLKVISNPELKAYFVRTFKPKSLESAPTVSPHPKK